MDSGVKIYSAVGYFLIELSLSLLTMIDLVLIVSIGEQELNDYLGMISFIKSALFYIISRSFNEGSLSTLIHRAKRLAFCETLLIIYMRLEHGKTNYAADTLCLYLSVLIAHTVCLIFRFQETSLNETTENTSLLTRNDSALIVGNSTSINRDTSTQTVNLDDMYIKSFTIRLKYCLAQMITLMALCSSVVAIVAVCSKGNNIVKVISLVLSITLNLILAIGTSKNFVDVTEFTCHLRLSSFTKITVLIGLVSYLVIISIFDIEFKVENIIIIFTAIFFQVVFKNLINHRKECKRWMPMIFE